MPSHLRGALRLAMTAARRRKGAMPRFAAVEAGGIATNPRRVRKYLAATRGTDFSRTLPITYPAVWETALTLDLLAAGGMPLPRRGIVHVASEIAVIRPLKIDDRVRCRLELDRVERHRRGSVLVLRADNWDAAGKLCQQSTTRLLLPGVQAGGGARGAPVPRTEEGEWREIEAWRIPRDAGVRYAFASGDFNPIHLWSVTSRLLGIPRPILHGHCTLAMIAHALERDAGRPPRYLSARFLTPLELPTRMRLEASRSGFRLVGARGEVFAEGSYG